MRSYAIKFLCGLLAMFFLVRGVAAGDDDSKTRIKKRVAVFVFEDKTDRSWRWWNRKGVGEGVSDMIITQLVKSGNYRVMERSELSSLLDEQKLNFSGIVTPESAAKAGQVLGVELAIIGAVTEFGYKKSNSGGFLKKVPFGGGISKQSCVVAIDVRLVNTSTSEIVAAETVRKEKSAKGFRINTKLGNFSTQKKFDESLVGKTSRAAVDGVINLLDESAPKIPWHAKVITENGGFVFINAGKQSGLKSGDRFVVYRPGEKLIDPDTGLDLGSVETRLGEIEVIDASIGQGKAAKCSAINGSGFKKSDVVKLR